VSRFVVSGGVAANGRLREKMTTLASREGVELCLAPRRLCTDNGAMIAKAGLLRLQDGQRDPLEMNADAGWELGSEARS